MALKDDVRLASDIVDLIGRYVQLKRSGRNYKGLCPFHSEKTPSFVVSPAQQTFHCFGCKKGGDIFAFWMEYHQTTFPEALKEIAERYNVTLPDKIVSQDEQKEAIKRNLLFEANKIAGRFFRKMLLDSKYGDKAGKYLENRGVSRENAVKLGLGYAPKDWDELCRVLESGKFSLETAHNAGLVVRRDKGGFYDRFRDRIIFPLINMKGQTVGFGGRVLNDSQPKYLNTPETEIFHKSNFLYGLNYSIDAIRQRKTVFVVEGYMDWLSMYLNGVQETVATLGTALTSWHVRKLKGLASNVVMVFDSDRAGIGAVLKSLPIFLSEGCQASVVILPEGHDPDSYIRSHGEDEFRSLFMRSSQPIVDFFLERKLMEGGYDIEGKTRAVSEIMPVIREINNNMRRSLYIQYIAEYLKLPEDVVWVEFRNNAKITAPLKLNDNSGRQNMSPPTLDEQRILAIMIHYPDTVKKLMACNCRSLISNITALEIVDFFHHQLVTTGVCNIEKAYNELKGEDARLLFNEVKTSSPLEFNEVELKLALEHIESKINKNKIKKTIKGEKSLESLNEVLELKRKMNKEDK